MNSGFTPNRLATRRERKVAAVDLKGSKLAAAYAAMASWRVGKLAEFSRGLMPNRLILIRCAVRCVQ
jgi:hypothetical protein